MCNVTNNKSLDFMEFFTFYSSPTTKMGQQIFPSNFRLILCTWALLLISQELSQGLFPKDFYAFTVNPFSIKSILEPVKETSVSHSCWNHVCIHTYNMLGMHALHLQGWGFDPPCALEISSSYSGFLPSPSTCCSVCSWVLQLAPWPGFPLTCTQSPLGKAPCSLGLCVRLVTCPFSTWLTMVSVK